MVRAYNPSTGEVEIQEAQRLKVFFVFHREPRPVWVVEGKGKERKGREEKERRERMGREWKKGKEKGKGRSKQQQQQNLPCSLLPEIL